MSGTMNVKTWIFFRWQTLAQVRQLREPRSSSRRRRRISRLDSNTTGIAEESSQNKTRFWTIMSTSGSFHYMLRRTVCQQSPRRILITFAVTFSCCLRSARIWISRTSVWIARRRRWGKKKAARLLGRRTLRCSTARAYRIEPDPKRPSSSDTWS